MNPTDAIGHGWGSDPTLSAARGSIIHCTWRIQRNISDTKCQLQNVSGHTSLPFSTRDTCKIHTTAHRQQRVRYNT